MTGKKKIHITNEFRWRMKGFSWMQQTILNPRWQKITEKGARKKKTKRGYQSKIVIHSHTGNFVIDSHILSRWEHYPGLLISKGVYFCITLIVTLKCKRLNLIQWRLTIEIAPHVCHRPTHWVRIQENYLPVRMRLLGERDDWFISCELCTQTRQKVLYCNLRN